MAAFHYEFSIQRLHKVEAQVVGEMIEDMHNRGIEVTPEAVLDASRDEDSPTHKEFEWDDTVAAEKYRLEQARELIGHIRIIRDDDPSPDYKERAFVSAPGANHVYVPLQSALGNEGYREHLLKQAKGDCEVFLAKYRRLQELAGVVGEMNEFLQKVS